MDEVDSGGYNKCFDSYVCQYGYASIDSQNDNVDKVAKAYSDDYYYKTSPKAITVALTIMTKATISNTDRLDSHGNCDNDNSDADADFLTAN